MFPSRVLPKGDQLGYVSNKFIILNFASIRGDTHKRHVLE